MSSPSRAPTRAAGPDSRILILLLLLAAALVAIVPARYARSRRVQEMRTGLLEVLQECRSRYQAATSAAVSAAADAWQPALHGERRPGDPVCGPYRRRNMLAPQAP